MAASVDGPQKRSNTWYEPSGVYEGSGFVYSETLKKRIHGEFAVAWNNSGDLHIQCKPSNLTFSEAMRIAEDFDKFNSLEVAAGTGRFVCRKCYLRGPNLHFGSQPGIDLAFKALAGTYLPATDFKPSVWNASLTNLVSVFRFRPGFMDRHPLRMFPMEEISGCSLGDTISKPNFAFSDKNRVCGFEFAGSEAFIEHLSDYKETENDLKNGISSIRVTSSIVGKIPNGVGFTPEEVKNWFPADVLVGLSLATGTRVGLGAIELRNNEANLHSRIHLAFMSGRYIGGHQAISELFHGDTVNSGLGAFLTCILKTQKDSMRRVSLLADAIDLAQDALRTPDHAFAFIVRALDGLANNLELARSDLVAELPAAIGAQVRHLLSVASKSIRGIHASGSTSTNAKVKTTLARVADRALSAASREDKFGLSLSRVLQHYRLDDESAVASFYTTRPRKDGLPWLQSLDLYRGRTIHHGFIDYSNGAQMVDVLSCTRHLLDIAMRICLREVGYAGTYNPFDLSATEQRPLDWVKTAKDVESFGYNGFIPKLIKFVEALPPKSGDPSLT